MAQDIERLVVTLAADIRSYEKAFAKASSLTVSALRGIEREAQVRGRGIERAMNSASAGLARFGNSFKELGAGLLAGFTAKAFIDAIAGAVNKLAEIGEMAERIGVTTDALQAMQRMAVLTGASVEQMDKALQSLAEQSAQKGSFLDKLFQANGQVLSNDVEKNLRRFMDLLQNAQSAQDRLLIATQVFGDKVGRSLVEAFSKGSDEVDRVLNGMIASGQRFSSAEIAEMKEIRDKYNLYMDDISLIWSRTVVNLIAKSGEWFAFQKANLNQMINDLGALGRVIEGVMFPMKGVTGDLDKLIARQAELTKSISEGLPGTPLVASLQAELATINQQIEALRERNKVIDDSVRVLHPPNAQVGAVIKPPTVIPVTTAGGGGTGKKPFDDRAAADKIIDELMVKSQEDAAKRLADALQADIDKMDEVRSTAQDMFRGVLEGIREGQSAGEILNNILTKLEDKMFDLASSGFADLLFGASGTAGGGAAGGFLAKLLRGGVKTFARGGVTHGPAIFGEHGSEAAVPLPDGRSIPVDLRLPKGLGNPQMSVKIENHGGAKISTQMNRGPNGPELRVIVDGIVGQGITSGRYDKPLGGRFNVTPAARRRT